MLKLALTGGIACGKSLAGQCLARMGIPVCETDTIGHAVLDDNNAVRSAIMDVFGTGVITPDGRVDRTALGKRVFANPEMREQLNRLTHPAILKQTAEWVEIQRKDHEAVVVIIPLLFEIGAEQEWDKVICVASPEADQRRRLEERGLSPEEAQARIQAQLGLATKMERADFVIYNCGSRELLEEQTKQVWRTIRGV